MSAGYTTERSHPKTKAMATRPAAQQSPVGRLILGVVCSTGIASHAGADLKLQVSD